MTDSHFPASNSTIMVVDDEPELVTVVRDILEQNGYRVMCAYDGTQVFDFLKKQKPDLVILDITMPQMDGYEVLERLKEDPTLRHIPVIMISALDEIDSVVRCIEHGAEDYLPKPFNPTLLQARVRGCLERKLIRDQEREHLKTIKSQNERYNQLLHALFPPEIVEQLANEVEIAPRRYENVSVMFCDVVGFTPYCDTHAPEDVVSNLQDLICVLETITSQQDLHKIKTIGDGYLAVGGLLTQVKNPVVKCVRAGLQMISAVGRTNLGWKLRVGIHYGPVVAGIVGGRQYQFDIWGDTVNTAARIESNGEASKVVISREAWEALPPERQGETLGLVNLKGKGEIEMFRVDSLTAS